VRQQGLSQALWLDLLAELATGCEAVVELVPDPGPSTTVFLWAAPTRLVTVHSLPWAEQPRLHRLREVADAEQPGTKWHYLQATEEEIWQDDLPRRDLLYLGALPPAGRLAALLAALQERTRHLIVSNRTDWPAVHAFLNEHPAWSLGESGRVGQPLAVLRRKEKSKP
jgi:hypothetical protein